MKVKFPLNVLKPIQVYLKNEEEKLKKRKKELEKEDPYINTDRLIDNAASDADAAEEVGHERVSALKLEINKNLIRIRKALTRIKLGKYGLCTKCGKMINTERLAVDPSAVLCVECAKKVKD
ncbi:MAG TPA: TraR/DksA C4-type zinc finger protein [Candidatus Bathyarchaeia archaeon]|nr:TraR/DksA C4-type zinc finger protein [Candidatus Bathyarchaeia archaeon]